MSSGHIIPYSWMKVIRSYSQTDSWWPNWTIVFSSFAA